MDYEKWSKEYLEEAQKIIRNIEILKKKQRTVPMEQRQTVVDRILRLRAIYYECLDSANYLAERAELMARGNVSVA